MFSLGRCIPCYSYFRYHGKDRAEVLRNWCECGRAEVRHYIPVKVGQWGRATVKVELCDLCLKEFEQVEQIK